MGSTPDAGAGGGEADAGASDAAAGADGGEGQVAVLHPDAAPLPGEPACVVTVTTGIVPGSASHLPLCTPIDYATNPPSGGPHWGLWAAFGESAAPIPRELYVHDLEHGSVVLAYRCDDGCPAVVEALRALLADQPADPSCADAVHDRLILTPDPLLAAPVAAAAWGATYTATCLDPASLRAFIDAHYAKAPENTCAQGLEPTDAGWGACDAGVEDGGRM